MNSIIAGIISRMKSKYKEFKNNGTMAMRELLKNGDKIKVKYEIGGK